jgi:hypothetical protein
VIRLANRLLAFVLGAALFAAGALVVIEAIWTWTGSGFVWIPGRQWLSSFKTTAWSNHQVVLISVGVAGLGLLLLIGEIRPQRRRVARFETERGSWLLLRRSTEAHLSRRLQTAVPTSPVRARLDPKLQRWHVRIVARAAASTRPQLEEAARNELGRLHAPRTRLHVKTTGARKS